MNIDWSKAPEWATHAMTTGPKWDGTPDLKGSTRYACLKGTKYVDYSGRDDAVLMIGKKSWVVAEDRPSPQWSGDGLPPVGTVCEAMTKEFGDHYGWFKCTVLHVGKDECAIMLDNSLLLWCDDFRPIRIPEQIAADEREKAIEHLLTLVMPHPTDEEAMAAIYDAGYRKQEQPK